MTIFIDLSVAGINTGPFNLYSNADAYASAFATNITRQQLLDGYPAVVLNGTTNIKLQSLSDICPNDTILYLNATTSTTTTLNCSFIVNAQEVTTTSTSTSTSSTSTSSTTTSTTEPLPPCTQWLAIVSSGGGYVDIISCGGEAVRVGVPFNPQNPQGQTPFCSTSIVGTSGNVGLTNNGVCP